MKNVCVFFFFNFSDIKPHTSSVGLVPLFKLEFHVLNMVIQLNHIKNSVAASQNGSFFSMLFRKTVCVYCNVLTYSNAYVERSASKESIDDKWRITIQSLCKISWQFVVSVKRVLVVYASNYIHSTPDLHFRPFIYLHIIPPYDLGCCYRWWETVHGRINKIEIKGELIRFLQYMRSGGTASRIFKLDADWPWMVNSTTPVALPQ